MKILFIACYSPFINNSAAIETLQYLNKLSEMKGNEVHLLTVDFPKDSIYYDEALSKMINKEVKVHLIEGGKLFNKLVPRKPKESNEKVPETSGNVKKMKLLRSIKNAVVIPDMYYHWSKTAGEFGIELMKKEKFDVIFSMHEPPSSHLCALKIKKEFKNVPWITYWSDPWLKDSTRENSNIVKKTIESNMEKNIVKSADKFIFVTEDNRQDYIKSYGIEEDKSFIITRGFDKRFFEEMKKEKKPDLIEEDKINIIYAGEIFSKLRNIRPFIEAVEEIKIKYPDKYEKMNILFFGNIDDAEAKERLSNLSIATVSKRIPFNEAIKYMLNSEVLLLFGNKNSKQIPAKIYEYFGAKGKVFVIYGDENDPIRKLTENHERCINSLNNKEDIKNNLLKLLNKDKQELLGEPDYSFEWNSIVERLNKILEV
ncbi:MAG: glycosyltransferase [Clostridium sp.]|uniref:glycosyltransferase n=1 Tax=Clostridium sp. DSM 8431 TaxID=1761781 RepID=UPI0008E79460|nr:glycosyltransferase [Clostridium sp. DSM 8431]MCR4943763.1 glycosyltransferase [Clostridium sp.]SFU28316.1 Glycosyl transferases group 1 [Clostridium sp. DSM 8431]